MAGAPDPITVVKFTALLLWCYGAVHLVLWTRLLIRAERHAHIGQIVSLLGEMVPVACGLVLVVALGALIGLPSVVVFIAVLTPAGLAWALRLEVNRLTGPPPWAEARRALAAALLAAALLLLQATA